jgi:RimJ/RimL family protein N-acetyltransferase
MFDLSIRTERLVLRPFVQADGPRVRELIGAWSVARHLARIPYPYPPGLAEEWIATHDAGRAAGEAFPFAVTLHNRLIGCAALHEERERGEVVLDRRLLLGPRLRDGSGAGSGRLRIRLARAGGTRGVAL